MGTSWIVEYLISGKAIIIAATAQHTVQTIQWNWQTLDDRRELKKDRGTAAKE